MVGSDRGIRTGIGWIQETGFIVVAQTHETEVFHLVLSEESVVESHRASTKILYV